MMTTTTRLLLRVSVPLLAVALMVLPARADHIDGSYHVEVSPPEAGRPVRTKHAVTADTVPSTVRVELPAGHLVAHADSVSGVPESPIDSRPADGDIVGKLVASGDFSFDGCGSTDANGPESADIDVVWSEPFEGGSASGKVAELAGSLGPTTVYAHVVQSGSAYALTADVPADAELCDGSEASVVVELFDTVKGDASKIVQTNPDEGGTYETCLTADGHRACADYEVVGGSRPSPGSGSPAGEGGASPAPGGASPAPGSPAPAPGGATPGPTPAPRPPAPKKVSPAAFRDGVWRLWDVSGREQTIIFGQSGDIPLVGDWDGDGFDAPAVWRDGIWMQRHSFTSGPAESTLAFGSASGTPIVGDWNGDGVDTPGIVVGSTWLLRNSNSTGGADASFVFGNPGDRPVAGRWSGTRQDTPAVYRRGTWYVRHSATSGPGDRSFVLGGFTDAPLAGDWDGDGTVEAVAVRDSLWLALSPESAKIFFSRLPVDGWTPLLRLA